MKEVEAVSEGLKNIGELGAVVVAALVLLVIAVLLVVWLLVQSRRDTKEREAQLIRENAERTNNGKLIESLGEHIKAGRDINEQLIKVLTGSNEVQAGVEKAVKDLEKMQNLAIGEVADQFRKTREDVGTVGTKVGLTTLPASGPSPTASSSTTRSNRVRSVCFHSGSVDTAATARR